MNGLKTIGLNLLLLIAGSCAVLATVWIALGIALQHNIWYFPGDPPYFDVSIIPATVALAFSGLTVFWTRGARGRAHANGLYRLSAVAIASFSAVVVLFCLSGIAFRFTPPWRGVRLGIREYGDRIAAAAGDKNRVLSTAEFESLRQRYMPTPVEVWMPGYGIVKLRMAHGIYPYVGVDFKAGGHALFNPATMWCMYSD